jgi:hypothetical protein
MQRRDILPCGILSVLLGLASSSAEAAHCPHGQMWRVHARKCVFKDHRYIAALPPRRVFIQQPREARPAVKPEPPAAAGLTPRDRTPATTTPPVAFSLPFTLPGSRLDHVATIIWRLPK